MSACTGGILSKDTGIPQHNMIMRRCEDVLALEKYHILKEGREPQVARCAAYRWCEKVLEVYDYAYSNPEPYLIIGTSAT